MLLLAQTNPGDEFVGGLCCGLIANLLIMVPIGGVIGHYAKGRWVDGAGLGFLLGPIGWILISVLEDRRRLCPYCRSSIDPKATVCPRCRQQLKQPKSESFYGQPQSFFGPEDDER